MLLTTAQLAHDPGDERIEVIADINSLIVWRASADGTPLLPCGVSKVLPDKSPHDSEAWLEAVHPDDRERVRPVWRQAIGSGTVFQAFYRLRQPDGTFRWSHGCGVPLLDDAGNVREWIGTIADMEDKLVAERARSDQRLRLALALNRIGVWDLDLANETIWFSDTTAEILGLSKTEPAARADAWALIHPDDRPRLRARVDDALAAGGSGRWEDEFRFIHVASGATLWVECITQAMPDDTGKPVRVLGTIRDVTARHAPA
jgi:PAS domain S-box-containing protein